MIFTIYINKDRSFPTETDLLVVSVMFSLKYK